MKTELFRIRNTKGKNCFILAKDYKEAILFAKIHGHITRFSSRVMIFSNIETLGSITQEILDRVAAMRIERVRGVISFSVCPSGQREPSATR